MGKYSDFAKGLDREFKAARDEYSAAYNAWQTAKDDLEKASLRTHYRCMESRSVNSLNS